MTKNPPAPNGTAPLLPIAERLAKLPPEQRQAFREALRRRGIDDGQLPIVPQADPAGAPLSFTQQRLWFLAELEKDTDGSAAAAYNISSALRLTGPLDRAALRAAFAGLIERHAALRTAIVNDDTAAGARQTVLAALPLPWTDTDLRALPATEREAAVQARALAAARHVFDLAHPPLLRLELLQLAADQHVLLLTLHHIIADGWSLGILLAEAAELYRARREARAPDLPPAELGFPDYAAWQRDWLQGEVLQQQLAYWTTLLGDEQPLLALPADRPRPPRQSFRGACHDFTLGPALTQSLRTLARSRGKTLFAVMLAAFNTLLFRCTGQRDLRVGTPIANRQRSEVQGVVGLFANTLVLKSTPQALQPFSALLEDTARGMIAAQSRQDLPFEQLVDALQPERDLSHTPLFQAMYVQHAVEPPVAFPGLAVAELTVPRETAKFDLTLEVVETDTQLQARLNYARDLFDPATMERMARHFECLLHGIAAAPDTPLALLPMLRKAEREQLVYGWNATATRYPEGGFVHQGFEAQAAATPDAEALVFAGESLSYRELNERANQLAHLLQQRGVGPDTVVAVCLPRSVALVVTLYAILKAGGAYLPLDPDYPADRRAFVQADAGARLRVTHSELAADAAANADGHTLQIDRLAAELATLPTANPGVALTPQHLAYVIYTSGSTGRPKGVGVPHGGLLNRLQWMQAEYRLTAADRVLQKTPYSFDVSVWEFFWPLMVGATLVVARPGEHRDTERLAALIQAQGISTLHFVPSMLRAFLDDPEAPRCASLRRVICSGEALPFDLQQRYFSLLPAELHNLYGPTEASIDVSYWPCRRHSHEATVPIGYPIANTQLYVLDAALNPVPVGVAGELHIGGVGLARGYLSRPGLTAEKFIADPFGATPGGRLYKTGDLARWRPDGAIEYLGRLDHQVKIRGFRIELGEIEARLAAHPAVADTVVVAREDRPGDKRLVAYWVARADVALPDDEAWRAWLRAELPDHMVPSAFVQLPAMPLNSNGKLDRKALPAPAFADAAPADRTAPRNAVERVLAEVWQDVLGLPEVGIHDNFFRIGGDSILSLQVAAKARQRGIRLTPKQMFEHQTIAEAAAAAGSGVAAPTRAEEAEHEAEDGAGDLPLTPIQHWFFAAGFRHPQHWNQAVLLSLREPLPAPVLEQGLAALVAHHAALRLRFERDAAGQWLQTVTDAAAPQLTTIDLRATAPADLAAAIAGHAEAAQASLLVRGPLLRAVLFNCGAGQPARLLLVIHHLAVDGVSWRVLLEDLQAACRAATNQTRPDLPPAASYRRWARHLQQLAAHPEVLASLDHWRTQGAVAPLPLASANNGQVGSAERVQVALDAETTRLLLTAAPAVLRTQINDLLLTALAQTLGARYRREAVLVELEGHGRQIDVAGLEAPDVERTVGWFTTRYPVRLPAAAADGISAALAALKVVKEALRAVPHQGASFGLLRYLGPPDIQAELATLPVPQVCFNYLGQFDRSFDARSLFGLADEPPGPTRHPEERRTHALDIDGQIFGGTLRFGWSYHPGQFTAAEVEALARDFIHRLERLVNELTTATPGATPSDFPLAALGQAELDTLPLPWANVADLYPLAPMQHGLLLHTLLNPGSGMYLMQDRYRLRGEVDPQAFVAAWEKVIERHPVLRTAFYWQNEDHPLQVVYRQVPPPVETLDWRDVPADQQDARLDALLAAELRQGFDLAEPRLIRFRLVRLGADAWFFTQSYHHVLIDAWCFSLLMVDFFAHYRALVGGGGAIPALPRPYADFIGWLRRQDPAAARDYWRQQLQGFEAPTPLMIAKLPEVRQHEGVEDRAIKLSREETAELLAAAQRHQLTPNTCTQAAWALLLSWYAGQEDVLFGVTVAGRPPELEGIEATVGLFINTLPLRVAVSPETPAVDFMRRLLAQNMEMRQYEHLPLSEVQALSPLGRGQALFDSLFVYENAPVDRSLGEWKARFRIDDKRARTHTNYPITVVIIPGEQLTLQLTYDRQLFDEAAILRMLGHFKALVLALLREPARPVAELPRLSAEEITQQAAWNNTGDGADVPDDLLPLFEEQVRQRPDAIAARCLDEAVSYAELDRRATAIGHLLQSRGVGPDQVVAVFDRRGIDFLAMILGTFKAGAAYLPLDPSHPAERLGQILAAGGAACVLAGRHERERLEAALTSAGAKAPALVEMQHATESASLPAGERVQSAQPLAKDAGHLLAYIIYTSGSTGVPKGAMVERRGMLNNLLQKQPQLGLTAGDVVAQTASAAFDISVWQFLSALLCGATVDIVPDDIAHDPHALLRHVSERGITVLESVPTLIRGLLDEAGGMDLPLRWLLPTGEALPPELARRWLARYPGIPLLNVYGPAECADDVSIHALRAPSEVSTDVVGAALPIGRPVAGLKLQVINRHGLPLPIGVAGELAIAGIGVGRGYLNDPLRTAAAFTPNPLAADPGERWYCTGDLVRQRPDGVYEYLGRIDHQVKLRGYRIELGEIEARLLALPGVRQSVAVVRTDRPSDPQLVAYVTPAADAVLEPAALRAALANGLPDYMVPAAIVALDALPLNANGKINRRALPAPDWAEAAGEVDDDPPQTPLEHALVKIWSEVLGRDGIGIRRNFFALGGHSLLATQVVSRIRRQLQVELPLRAVFDRPTIAELASAVASADNTAPATTTEPPLAPVERGEFAPLSFAQERMAFLAELEPDSSAYHIPVVLELRGALDQAALEQAFTRLMARHEVLRSVIVAAPSGGLAQRALPAGPYVLPMLDLNNAAAAGRAALARQYAATEIARRFDLGRDLPWRALLLRLEENRHWLVFTLHHIAGDGWSLGVMMNELAAFYGAALSGTDAALPALPLQYADFAHWQRQWLEAGAMERQLGYWRQQLGTEAPALALPTDRPRPAVQTFHGATHELALEPVLADRLRVLGERHGATPFMTLLAAYALLLHRYSGQSDIRIGTPIANRQRLETEGLIGLFANTLVMRSEFAPGLTLAGLLARTRDTALEAQAHQDLPFERLVEALQPARDLGISPLFQAMFILQNAPMGTPALPGLEVSAVPPGTTTAKFDLTLTVHEEQGRWRASFEYNTDLFDASTVARMAAHWRTLLETMAEDPQSGLADWPLLSSTEARQQLIAWNDTARAPTLDDVLSGFREQLERRPDAFAVICGTKRLTYQQLDREAERLAAVLRERLPAFNGGGHPDPFVGICLRRSPAMLAALLAVLRCGAAYLPLDPAYPAERLAWMLEDAKPALVLTESGVIDRLPSHLAPTLCIDQMPKPRRRTLKSRERPVVADQLAYCIYTSGSTGRPKGVQVTHGALANLLDSMREQIGFGSSETLLAVTSLSFDIAALELFLPLMSGGTVLLATSDEAGDAGALLRLLHHAPVTTLQATPATWRMLLDAGWQSAARPLRALCGGEALPPDLAAALNERCQAVWNVYGPTETTIWSTLHQVEGEGMPPIGRPLANTTLYILDGALQPVPIGVAGELYIGGDGLARGYLNRPDLTAERFVPNPLQSGARLYRTGDLACWRPDGTVRCLGRSDRQVKIRGYRIELDEIEAALGKLPAVGQAAVRVFGGGQGEAEAQLVAYVVRAQADPDAGSLPAAAATTESLRQGLTQTLPAFMLPARFVFLDALPLTPNGKVDRKALPAPADLGNPSSERHYVAPTTPLEALLANVWQTLLQVAPIGTGDNFFELGGHSLLAVRVMQRVRQLLARDLPLTLLFQAPTIAGLAALLQADGQSAGNVLLPLRAIDETSAGRPPLFCVHPAGGHVAAYLPLAEALGPEQPVYGLQSRSLLDPAWRDQSVAAMARDYVAAIRQIQPEGPYHLLGWSLGGFIATAMASELERSGQPVKFVAVLDAALHGNSEAAARHDRASEYLDYLDGLRRRPLPADQRRQLLHQLQALDVAAQLPWLVDWAKASGDLPQDVDLAEIELRVGVRDTANRLMREHQVVPFQAPLLLWWAEETLDALAAENGGSAIAADGGWARFAQGGWQGATLSGGHWDVVRAPEVHRALGRLLGE